MPRGTRDKVRDLSHPYARPDSGKRQTRNSRAAGYAPAPSRISVPESHAADNFSGTYGYERHHGSRRLNKGRQTPIPTEADHAPTDGSLRGNLPRGSAQNTAQTFDRIAFSVPKPLHRKHPTTGGRDGGQMANAQKRMRFGYPHVGDDASAQQRGRFEGFNMHLQAYQPLVASGPKYGQGVFDGVKEGVTNAVNRMQQRSDISPTQSQTLLQQAGEIFKKP